MQPNTISNESKPIEHFKKLHKQLQIYRVDQKKFTVASKIDFWKIQKQ